MANNSVIDVLSAAGLYKSVGRIPEEMLMTITPTGETREHRMAEIDYRDIQIFGDQLEIVMQLQNPLVQALFAKNAVALANLIRCVNTETSSGFKGSNGSGRQLDFLLLRAEQFGNPDLANSATVRTTWIRAVGLGLNVQLVIAQDALGANTHGPLTMGQTEGFAILGFANPAAAPCVDAVQPSYLAQAYNIQNADFAFANPFQGDSICELMQPLIVYPQESCQVDVRYYQAGQDEMTPIGIWVKMSQNLRALATS